VHAVVPRSPPARRAPHASRRRGELGHTPPSRRAFAKLRRDRRVPCVRRRRGRRRPSELIREGPRPHAERPRERALCAHREKPRARARLHREQRPDQLSLRARPPRSIVNAESFATTRWCRPRHHRSDSTAPHRRPAAAGASCTSDWSSTLRRGRR